MTGPHDAEDMEGIQGCLLGYQRLNCGADQTTKVAINLIVVVAILYHIATLGILVWKLRSYRAAPYAQIQVAVVFYRLQVSTLSEVSYACRASLRQVPVLMFTVRLADDRLGCMLICSCLWSFMQACAFKSAQFSVFDQCTLFYAQVSVLVAWSSRFPCLLILRTYWCYSNSAVLLRLLLPKAAAAILCECFQC